MAGYSFDQLIEAIAGAVVEAESVVRQRQIANVLSYFQPDGSPTTIDFKLLPPGGDSATTEPGILKAPLLALVPFSSLAIKDMRIAFSTELGNIDTPQPGHAGVADAVAPSAAARLTALGLMAKGAVINVAPPATVRRASPSTATVKLRVVASEPPEGLARLIDRLNKGI